MEENGSKSMLAAFGVLALLPLVCCGGPILLTLFGATSISAILGTIANSWITAGILFILIVGGSTITIRRLRSRQTDCCSSSKMKIEHHDCRCDGRGE